MINSLRTLANPGEHFVFARHVAIDLQAGLGQLLEQPRGCRPSVDLQHQHAGPFRRGGVIFQLRPIAADKRVGFVDDDHPPPAAEQGDGGQFVEDGSRLNIVAFERAEAKLRVFAAKHGTAQRFERFGLQKRLVAEQHANRPRRKLLRSRQIPQRGDPFGIGT